MFDGVRRVFLSLAVEGIVGFVILPMLGNPHEPKLSIAQGEPPSSFSAKADTPSTSAPVVDDNPLGEAMELARRGDWDAAIKKYQQVIQERPKSPDAYAGIARCYLKKKDVLQAYETVTKGLQVSDAWPVRVALGEVYFRQGKITEAEKEWVGVIKSGHAAARAYFGLARVRWAIRMNKTAKTLIDKAHELDPKDPDIQRSWIGTLRRSDQIKYYEESLAGASDLDADQRRRMQEHLVYLKERAQPNSRPCRLASKLTNTETPLVRLLIDPKHLRGYGLSVALNGIRVNLMLDTGASGIVVRRHIAEKARINKIVETKVGGVGDGGLKGAYVGTADTIGIGELEFQNCPIEVLESRSVANEDGLIGADVFAEFLVEIDFPHEKLKLSELPKRPGEEDQKLALKSDDDDSDDPEKPKAEKPDKTEAARPTALGGNSSGPQDRYVAPEMQSFTRVYRFGHQLLVPTKIGDVPEKLFVLDTGAFTNGISPDAAREVTKVQGSDTIVKGISGSVKKVYRADKAVLQFGHLRQENQDMLSFDTTSISNSAGTEISGFLGFALLRFLDIKIDYRDALVDFMYAPKPFGAF